MEERFSSDLWPIEGVPEMLRAIDLPKCIASSGPPAKIRDALEVCGLAWHFKGNIVFHSMSDLAAFIACGGDAAQEVIAGDFHLERA